MYNLRNYQIDVIWPEWDLVGYWGGLGLLPAGGPPRYQWVEVAITPTRDPL